MRNKAFAVAVFSFSLAVSCSRLSPNKLDEGRYTPLMRAAERGDVGEIRSLLRRGADPNYRVRKVTSYSILFPFKTVEYKDATHEGWSPLIVAVRANRLPSVRELLRRGADPNVESFGMGVTPLWFAAQTADAAIVDVLVTAGAGRAHRDPEALVSAAGRGDVAIASRLLQANIGRSHAGNALVEASRHGNVEVLRLLAPLGATGNEGDALLAAAAENRVDAIRHLVGQGVSPEAKGIPVGWTGLGLAADKGHVEAAHALAASGADVNAPQTSYGGDAGMPPLAIAARKGHVGVVRVLIAAQADLEAPDGNRQTALAHAARAGHREIVDMLLGAGASDRSLRTLELLDAVKSARLEAARSALAAGADVHVKDAHDGRSVLALASLAGHVELVRALLARGARPNEGDTAGQTPLVLATVGGHVQVMGDLLRAGADVDGGRPLLYAVHQKNPDVLKRLLSAGPTASAKGEALDRAAASADPSKIDMLLAAGVPREAVTAALLQATQTGREAVAERLVRAGADFTARSREDKTVLMIAAEAGHAALVRALIAARAPLDLKTKQGQTAVLLAAAKRRGDVVQRLLAAGADSAGVKEVELIEAAGKGDLDTVKRLLAERIDVNWRLETWSTYARPALVEAAAAGHADVVRALLEAKADVNAHGRGPSGRSETAVGMAAFWGRPEALRLLIDAGGDVNFRDNSGFTPLHFARLNRENSMEPDAKPRHDRVIRMLEQAGARDAE